MDGPLPAIAAMAADRAVLRAAFAEAGLGLVLLGADPLRPAKRVNPATGTARWSSSSRPARPAPPVRR